MTTQPVDLLDGFWVFTTQVRRYEGTSGYGDEIYEDSTSEACWVDDQTRMVRDARGDEVVSSTTVFYPLEVRRIPVGSLVTLPDVHGGREATVLAVSVLSSGGSFALPEHVEVSLT